MECTLNWKNISTLHTIAPVINHLTCCILCTNCASVYTYIYIEIENSSILYINTCDSGILGFVLKKGKKTQQQQQEVHTLKVDSF